jgi:hypothetical protein
VFLEQFTFGFQPILLILPVSAASLDVNLESTYFDFLTPGTILGSL